MVSREEAEKAVLVAYERLTAYRQAKENFARFCQKAHELGVSDGKISKLIDFGYSRSRIQQWRNEQKTKDELKEKRRESSNED